MSTSYEISIPTFNVPAITVMKNINQIIDNWNKIRRTSQLAISNYVKTVTFIQPPLVHDSLKTMSEIARNNSMNYSAIIASVLHNINSFTILHPLITPDLLRRQYVADDEVQATDQIVHPTPLFSFDSDFYQARFDDFKKQTNQDTATNHLKIFFKQLLSLLRFSRNSIYDEILSILVWSPFIQFSWHGLTLLIHWFQTLLN